MTPEQSLLILKWQIAAATLMGLDYFIPDNIREKANSYVRNYFEGMQSRVDKTMTDAVIQFKSELPRILISFLQIGLGVGCFVLSGHIEAISMVAAIILMLVAIFFIVAGFNFAFNSVFNFLTTLGLATPFKLTTIFLVGSPKGPVAAIGFCCLAVSFYLRYIYISI